MVKLDKRSFFCLKRVGSSIRDLHPISLIGSIDKILANVLANLLRKLFSDVISENQSAFCGCPANSWIV